MRRCTSGQRVSAKICQSLYVLTSHWSWVYYGLPDDVDRAINTGVLVLSALYHRALLESVYNNYEEKGGREWHMEQRPMSYDLLKGDHVHFLDPRFNVMLPVELITYYPFLIESPVTLVKKGLLERVQRKMWKLLGDPLQSLRADCVNAVYQSSFFLHFGGDKHDIPLVPLPACIEPPTGFDISSRQSQSAIPTRTPIINILGHG
jgi:hypothetical protein